MQQLEAKKHLADALGAVERVVRFTSGTIGEALVRLRDRSAATLDGISDHRRIIRFRNIVVHGYDVLAHDTVWDIVQQQVRRLRAELATLLDRR